MRMFQNYFQDSNSGSKQAVSTWNVSKESSTEFELKKNIENKKILNHIYLQETNYQIKQDKVQTAESSTQIPIKLYKAIKQLKTGRVYEVLTKNERRKRSRRNIYEQTEVKFLIYVITQEVKFDGCLQTIVYLKDVSFGVLYE